MDVLTSLAIERDALVADLDTGRADADVKPFTDHEARIEEDAWALYEAEQRFGDLPPEQVEEAFIRWRVSRLGQSPVAAETQTLTSS